MSILEILCGLLLIATQVYASSSPCGDSNITAHNNSDLSNLGTCTTLAGNLRIAADFAEASIELPGVETISGSFIIESAAKITNLTIVVQNIDGALQISNMTALTGISFNGLKSVGSLALAGLPQLNSLSHTGDQSFDAGDIMIAGTVLSGLQGLNITNATALDISDNVNIANITLPVTSLGNITIADNGNGTIASFPNLKHAGGVAFKGCSSISAPLLEDVAGSLIVANNTVTAFYLPALTNIQGALTINGTFRNVSLPQLSHVAGAFSINNNGTTDVCSAFSSFQGNSTKLAGPYSCNDQSQSPTSSAAPSPSSTPSSATPAGSPSPTTAKKAGATTNRQSALGLVFVIVVGMCLMA